MKLIFNDVTVFVAGFILGEISMKSIIYQVINEISQLNMDSVLDS